MGASKQSIDFCVTYEGRRRQVNLRGIREPKGRVKGFRVEIRPSYSKKKIWVGTFESMEKAIRAYDVGVYLTGKVPYYHIYPDNYFPKRPSELSFLKLRSIVQNEAKKYAQRNDPFPVNPSSLMEISTRAPRGLTMISKSVGNRQLVGVDTQVVSMEGNLTDIPEEVEMDVMLAEQEEFEEFSHPSSHHDDHPSTDPWLHYKVKVPEAYLRGLNAPNPDVIDNALLDTPSESFNVFPYIQGVSHNSILDVFMEDPSSQLIGGSESPPSWSTFLEVSLDILTDPEAMADWFRE